MKKPKTYGLSHIAITVRDLEKTSSFYQKVFDMEVMYKEENFLQLTTPGSHDIIVFEKKKASYGETGGITHFGFRLKKADDIDEMAERIKSAGEKLLQKVSFARASLIYFSKTRMDMK